MAFNPNKPDSGKSPAVDAPTILTDFAQFAAIFSSTSGGVNYNHTAMNNKNQGDHEAIIMQLQTADPGVDTNIVALYAKDAAATTGGPQPQLFAQIQKFLPTNLDSTNAQNVGMQLTYNSVNTSGPIYQSFLPGGYLVYLGSTTSLPATITVSPTPTKILVALASANNVNGSSVPFDVATNILSNTQFTITSLTASGSYRFSWIALAQA